MSRRTSGVGILLFFSGMCALMYQVVWLRDMRMVFGASTASTAAVLAIFMGGLGIGGAVLGARADRSANALLLYGNLQLLIAISAAVTPLLLAWVRAAYIGMGGSLALSSSLATVVRVGLAALVLGVPTILMGGTLPAAARAVMAKADTGRLGLARLYGMNTLGAVAGTAIATFSLMETVGARMTLFVSCLLSVVVAMTARALARTPAAAQPSRSPEVGTPAQSGAQTPPGFVFAAAGISGFAFFLMELVWYRMLSPILGGSTYTFGLILALALAGIGLGGFLYALRDQRSAPSPMDLAVTFALEALFIALPLALGDRLAVMAGLVAPLGNIGLLGSVAGWTIVASMVLLPAAVVSGFQFPLLIALLGRGEDEIGRHAGFAYAWNTFGAIIGSLAGGFLLVPILSAPGAWRLVVICLALLSVASLVVGHRGRDGSPSWASAIVVACALACLVAPGPTAPWRHGGIGAGRVDLSARDRHMIRDWASAQRRALVWEREGRESSIGVFRTSGLSLMINGKSDGNAIADASTQIMLGLVGATMHHEPRTALVIGLGTGETAGWLADIAGMERVDVVEFEPAVLDMARMCGPANREALNNPRVRLYIGDGREMVLVAKERYDLIVSEPSNPFRAGIASLYTQEFYRAVAQRLGTGGIFTQWVQAYEVDTETILSIYATLGEVFPWVETWQTNPIDMLLVCSLDSLRMDRQAMARRLEEEPLRSGVLMAWGASDVEGLLARRIAGPELGRRSADIGRAFGLTTDDRTLVEYGFARAVGKARAFRLADLRQVGEGAVEEPESPGAVAIRRNRQAMYALQGIPVPLSEIQGEDEHARAQGYSHFLAGEYGPCLAAWRRQDAPATYPLELAMVGEATADEGDDEALALAQRLAPLWPAEAAVIRARLWVRTGESEMALGSLEEAFAHMRLEPLPCSRVMERGLRLAVEIASSRPDLASRCRAGVAVPFSVDALHDARLRALLDVSRVIGPKEAADVIHQYEPHIPWDREFLALRATCYREADDPLAGVAMADWEDYVADAPLAVNEDLFARAAP